MKISGLGIDLGKHTFHVYGVDAHGHQVIQKQFSWAKLLAFMVRLEPCRVGMEACGGAHCLARLFQSDGHEVRLMSRRWSSPMSSPPSWSTSQRETADDRGARRADSIRERLGWEPGILNGPGLKPKGMHWRTFERLKAEHDAFVAESLAGMMTEIERRFGRLQEAMPNCD